MTMMITMVWVFQRSLATSLMKLLLDYCPFPVVTKVDGIAAVVGCQLTAMIDIAVASTNSVFSTTSVNLGLFCSTPSIVVCTRSIPMKSTIYALYWTSYIN
ncbi:hypothetical protein GHT06_008120 [Daphnia sinensis]|uniref:Secreted protein n=1 Tax=Daphnia sinensis TaxID=1820382 RepID=A0AAD5L0U6_9CRUS|nr:hypothetical protein GHT06_008120 [Daphnia sinensis]